MKNQKGITSLVILLIVVALVVGFLYVKQMNNAGKDLGTDMNPVETVDNVEEFEVLKEDETTPAEIDDATVEELDKLMEEVDTTSNEDLTDLDL